MRFIRSIAFILMAMLFWSLFQGLRRGWTTVLVAQMGLLLLGVLGCLIASRKEMDDDEVVSTGCAGIILPLMFALPAIAWIIRQRTSPVRLRDIGRPPLLGEKAIWLGILALGMCLVLHGWYYAPYKRYPVVRWFLIVVGTVITVYASIHQITLLRG